MSTGPVPPKTGPAHPLLPPVFSHHGPTLHGPDPVVKPSFRWQARRRPLPAISGRMSLAGLSCVWPLVGTPVFITSGAVRVTSGAVIDTYGGSFSKTASGIGDGSTASAVSTAAVRSTRSPAFRSARSTTSRSCKARDRWRRWAWHWPGQMCCAGSSGADPLRAISSSESRDCCGGQVTPSEHGVGAKVGRRLPGDQVRIVIP